MTYQHILAFLCGAALVVMTLRSAARTFVLPRGINDTLTRLVFLGISRLFLLAARPTRPFEVRDRVMAFFPPVLLLCLPIVWVVIVTAGYTGMFWACGEGNAESSYMISVSSLATLGFVVPHTLTLAILAFSEAVVGLLLLTLLIAYLPTIYGAFSKRELAVALLEVRAGSPPSAVEMIKRFHRLGRLDKLTDLWESWEMWFTELEETHTSLGILAYFRSSQADHSWITASGAVLDAASLTCSVVDMPRDAQAQLTIRAGYIALRRIGDFFGVPYETDGHWSDPISITRPEFDAACGELAEAGVPLIDDWDQAWKDFVGWRINYDSVLLELASITIAPYAPWSSDRARARRVV